MKLSLLLLGIVSGFTVTAGPVVNLPDSFYGRKGLEKMPRIDYAAMPSVNVRDCGADPSGKQTVNEAFDRALTQLKAKGGGVLYVPSGIYRFTSPVSSPVGRTSWRQDNLNNIHIVGDGAEKSIITVDWDAYKNSGDPATYLWSFNNSQNISIRDLGFSQFPVFGMRSPRACEGVFALAFGGNTVVQVNRVNSDQGRMGICFWGKNKDAWVVDCDVRNTGADAIKFDSCSDVVAAYNYIENNNDDGFSGLHMKVAPSVNNAFLYNTLVYNHGWGRGIAISGKNHRVIGNWIEAQAMPSILFHPLGFKSSKPEDAVNSGHVVDDNTVIRGDLHSISGNRLAGHRYGGGMAIGYPFLDLKVRRNLIAGCTGDGFGAVNFTSTQIDGLLLADNRIVGNLGYGIGLRASKPGSFIRNLTMENNILTDNRNSILMFGNIVVSRSNGNQIGQPGMVGKGESPLQGVVPAGFEVKKNVAEYRDVYLSARNAPDEKGWRKVPAVTPGQGNIVNVRDFGAKGNGSDCDTAAFVKAIAALPSSGGMLRIPAGRYLIEPLPGNDSLPFTCIRHHLAITEKSNVHIVGEGEKSVLLFTSLKHEGLRLINLRDSSIRDLVLEVKGKSYMRKNRAPLDLVAGENLVIANVISRNSAGHGIRLDACTGVLFERCRIDKAGQIGLNLLGGRQIFVRDTVITDSRDHGINIGSIGGIGRVPQYISIENCEITGTREGHGVSVPYGDRIVIKNNRIKDTYQAAVAVYYTNAIFPVEKVDIVGNTMSNCAAGKLSYMRGVISLFHITAKARRSSGNSELLIEGNTIRSTPVNGIWVTGCKGMGKLTLKGNRFDGVGGEKIAIAEEQRKEIAQLKEE